MAAVSARSTSGPEADRVGEQGALGVGPPPSGPMQTGRSSEARRPTPVGARPPRRARGRPRRSRVRPPGSQQRRDCIAASRAMRTSRSCWRAALASSQRTTERSARNGTMRSTPSSVSFCTTSSGLSAFTSANATVSSAGRRRVDAPRRRRLETPRRSGTGATPPAVGRGQGVTGPQPPHRGQVVRGRPASSTGPATSSTTTWGVGAGRAAGASATGIT